MDETESTTEALANDLASAAREGFASPLAQESDSPAESEGAGRIRVGAWLRGTSLAEVALVHADPASGVRIAAADIASTLEEGQRSDTALILDVEVVDEVETIEAGGLNELIASVELGLHGLVLTDTKTKKSAGGWPSRAQREFSGSAQWVKWLLRQARPPGVRLPESVRVERFTTTHLVVPLNLPTAEKADPATTDQETAAEKPQRDTTTVQTLVGGIQVVPQETLSQRRMLDAATYAGFWLLRHRLDDGRFRYEFQPGTQSWSNADSIVRQAGCAWSVAALATAYRGGQSKSFQDLGKTFSGAAMQSISGILSAGLKRDGPGRLYYIEASGEPRLGAIPLILLAVTDLRSENFNKDLGSRLTQTLLAVQRADGSFGSSARGLEMEGSEKYFAGQIALALARRYFVDKKPRIDDAVSRSLSYYQDWWADGNADLSFAAWMLQACESHHRHTPDPQSKATAKRFAYQMADWALQFQHGAGHANPLWVGGFDKSPGIGTAAYTEGMIRALVIAIADNDFERIGLYRRSVALALRFLLQLQVEPADLAFIGGEEHRGAVRGSLRRRNLRCDNAQHFLMATLRASAVLQDADLKLESVQ
jgi:hypothetical protein